MNRFIRAVIIISSLLSSGLAAQSWGISSSLSFLLPSVESNLSNSTSLFNSPAQPGAGIQIWYSKQDKINVWCRHSFGLDYSGYIPVSHLLDLTLVEKQTGNYINTTGKIRYGVQNLMLQYCFQFPLIEDGFLHAGIGMGIGIVRTHYVFEAEGYDLEKYVNLYATSFSGTVADVLADGSVSLTYEFERFFIFGGLNIGYSLPYTDPFIIFQTRLSAGIILPLIQK